MRARFADLVLGGLPLLVAAAPAMAQKAAMAAPTLTSAAGDTVEPVAADSGSTGDILVTARRRQERSQDVPVAVTAIGGNQLEATRTFNLRDVQQLTPSLVVTVTNPRNTSINIRGLGNNVSVYNDGL